MHMGRWRTTEIFFMKLGRLFSFVIIFSLLDTYISSNSSDCMLVIKISLFYASRGGKERKIDNEKLIERDMVL